MTEPTRPTDAAPLPLTEVVARLGDWTDVPVDVRPPARGDAASRVEVTGVTLSSLRVRPGDLYAALPGARTHGVAHAAAALEAGAVAVLTDAAGADGLEEAVAARVPVLVVAEPRALLGRLAAAIYGDPAEALCVIGVTGTQGKTTTTRLLESGLQRAGERAAVVGTVGTRIDGVDVPTSLTTPEAPDLHGLFAVMRERGVRVCAMEVSSHALVLGRVDGVRFDVAVFLNLGRDHLDFHDDVEDYFLAKASMFTPERTSRALVNADDEHGRRLVDLARERGVPVRTFSASGGAADWRAVDVVPTAHSSTFTVRGPDGLELPAFSPLPGDVNVANVLTAVAAAGEAGLDPAVVARGLAGSPGVPGRFEQVGRPGRSVLVDYAHKPDAVAAALRALRPLTTGRLAIVVGAGGDRDRGKRPIMGATAARLADLVVVTDDNPRTEDPAAIRAAVLSGAAQEDGDAEVIEVPGRREAIAEVLRRTGPGDVVLVAGKGHETGQEVRGVVHPFDDRVEARALLADEVAP